MKTIRRFLQRAIALHLTVGSFLLLVFSIVKPSGVEDFAVLAGIVLTLVALVIQCWWSGENGTVLQNASGLRIPEVGYDRAFAIAGVVALTAWMIRALQLMLS